MYCPRPKVSDGSLITKLPEGCGYSTGTGTQVRVPAPYICMASNHACAVGQVHVQSILPAFEHA